MELRDLFKNQDATEFCIVTIPTQLAIAESKRLLEALNAQGVAVRNIVVNQVRTFILAWDIEQLLGSWFGQGAEGGGLKSARGGWTKSRTVYFFSSLFSRQPVC